MNEIFLALSDPNRRKILQILKKRDMSAGEILKYFDIRGSSLSHHLDVLKKAELVTSQKKGKYIFYSLNASFLERVLTKFFNNLKK
ncbi:autorepressor SdpR family transcription factor [Patescibacteria group bacterium]|nr:autorepressor SdpR family transcription factor [Patescibacteria group bacterium]